MYNADTTIVYDNNIKHTIVCVNAHQQCWERTVAFMEKSTFGKRLGRIMQEKDISRTELKDSTGISLQSISNYLNDKRRPDCDMVVELAEALNVSADYLLGLSEVSTRNETIQGINMETGLWEDAVSRLRVEKFIGDDEISDFISYLVVNPHISDLISAVKGKNRFAADPKSVTIDVEGEDYSTDMKALFKMIVSDLFFEIIDGYTAKPGDIMVGYKAGE